MPTPIPTEMSASDYSIETRIQKLEEVTVQFAAHTAAEEVRFEMISNQIKDLSNTVENGMKELREALVALQKKEQTRDGTIEILLKDKTEREERVKWVKRIAYAAAVAIGGGTLTKLGEAIWQWLGG